jgi:hypothetical protein
LACERTYSFSLLILLHRTLHIGSCAWHSTAGQLVLPFLDTAGIRDGRSASPLQPTGSGDTFSAYILQLVILILALVMGLTWSIFDRRKRSYIRLHGWLRVLARYALAFALLSYAFSKVIPTQFIHLQNSQLAESYGRSSPMGLLWKFMGYSTAYTFFGGCAELLPAVFLLFRRTALLGSLLAFTVMLNVVMLNFCFLPDYKLLQRYRRRPQTCRFQNYLS